MTIFVGIDWGNEAHQICCADESGKVLWERSIKHEAQAVAAVIDQMISSAAGEPQQVSVAIERPHGLLVEALLERKVKVFAINPKQLDRFRDRFSPAGAKDDRRDARVLADSVRTDPRAFFEVTLAPAQEIELQTHSRFRQAITEQTVQASNRLTDQLRRYYPQILELGSAAEAWIWSLLELAPTPTKGAKLRLSQVERLLTLHRIRRLEASEVRAILRKPGFHVAGGTVEAASAEVALLIEQLRLFASQEKRCVKQIERLLRACSEAQLAEYADNQPSDERERPQPPRASDVEIIDSMPGVASILCATMLSEAGTALKRRDYTMLRTHSGSAPVSRITGKAKPVVIQRYACNGRLRDACHLMARSAVRTDELCREHYARLRASGRGDARALRSVADRLLRILIAALRDGTRYDITRLRPSLDRAA